MPSCKYKLTYFNNRGTAEVSRLVLKLAKQEFVDERLEFEGEEWKKRKQDTLLEALPVLEVDGKTVCQSAAIARYLAKEHGLMGTNNLEELCIDEVMETFSEILERELMKIFMESDNDKKKELRKTFSDGTMKKYLKFVERRLEENKGACFLLGKNLSLGDLVIYCGLEMFKDNELEPLKDRPLLKAHFDAVAAEPHIAKWIQERPKTSF